MATHYRVLYPFSAEARGELTVAANVRVELIAGEEHAGEGWCVAKRLDTEETGLLPMSYLATVDVATPAAPPAGATPPTTPGGSLPCPRPVLSLSPLLTHASPPLLEQVRDLLEQQMAIEDAAADAAVAATPGLSPTSAAGSAVKYARAVGRDSPGAY